MELKYHDISININPIPSLGTIKDSFNEIADGTNEQQRNGRRVIIHLIQWQGVFELPAQPVGVTALPPDEVRVILYVDKQCNGATATVSDFFPSSDIHSYYTLDQSDRFNILYDQRHVINYGGITQSNPANYFVQSPNKIPFTIEVPCSVKLQFSGATGALTEIRSNNIGALLISSRGVSYITSRARLRFTD